MASAEYPTPASRPATDRTQSLSPLFSWITSTAPRGVAAGAQLPSSSPRGPVQLAGVVGRAAAIPGGGAFDALDDGGDEAWGAGGLFSPQAAINAVAAAPPTPSSASRRRASRRLSSPST